MKPIKIIIYVLALLSLSFFQTAIAQSSQCSASAVFSEPTEGSAPKLGAGTKTIVKISSSGCDEGLSLEIYGVDEDDVHHQLMVNDLPPILYPEEDTGRLWLELNADEAFPEGCDGDNNEPDGGDWGYECVNYIKLVNPTNSVDVFDASKPSLLATDTKPQSQDTAATIRQRESNFRDRGVLLTNCDGSCDTGDINNNNDSDNWAFNEIINGTTRDPNLCLPTFATFHHEEAIRSGSTGAIVRYDPLSIEDLVSREVTLLLTTGAESLNGSCLAKENKVLITGKTGNQNNELSFSFPELFNTNGQSRFRYTRPKKLIKIRDFCEDNYQCSIQIKYIIDGVEIDAGPPLLSESNGTFDFLCPTEACLNASFLFQTITTIELEDEGVEQSSTCKIEKEGVWWELSDQTGIVDGRISTLNMRTSGCQEEELNLRLYEFNTGGEMDFGKIIDFRNEKAPASGDGSERHYFYVPNDELYQVFFKMGEEECNRDTGVTYHCRIGVVVDNNINGDSYIFQAIGLPEQSVNPDNNLIEGRLYLRCDDSCGGNDWEILGDNGISLNGGSQSIQIPKLFDINSPCYRKDLDDETKGNQEGYLPNCYELLAPIPGIASNYIDGYGNTRNTGFKIDPDTKRQYIEDTSKVELGDYINTIFRIALGILIVLSVLMIIVAGVEYMTVESIFGKQVARSRITNALTGLLLGLGIFLILTTINPRLLEVNFTPPPVSLSFKANEVNPLDYTSDTTYKLSGKLSPSFEVPVKLASGGIGQETPKDLLIANKKIKEIRVTGDKEGATEGSMEIVFEDDSFSGIIPVGFGLGGITKNWESDQKKTPTGTFTLGKNRLAKSGNKNKAVLSITKNDQGQYSNFGPAFISIDQEKYVGIGLHGKSSAASLSNTYGCIRIKNQDLIQIMNSIEAGTKIVISIK